MSDDHKRCTQCHQWKPLDDFALVHRQRANRRRQCKACWTANKRVESVYCSKCQRWKGPGSFSRNRNKPNGLQDWCNPCRKGSGMAQAWDGEACARCGVPVNEAVFPRPRHTPEITSSWCINCHKAEWAKLAPHQARAMERHWILPPGHAKGNNCR